MYENYCRVYSAAQEPIEIYNETICIDGQTVDIPEEKQCLIGPTKIKTMPECGREA